MVIPDLFSTIYSTLIEYWQGKIEKADRMGYVRRENEAKAQLNEILDKADKELADYYALTVKNRVEQTCYEICLLMFQFSFKAGMEMQKAFDEFE